MNGPRVALALAGAALGWGLWQAGAGLLPEADPARWTTRGGAVPIEVADLAGALAPRPDALDLWSHRAAAPRLAPMGDGTVTVEAVVPDGGQLLVRLGAHGWGGPAAPSRAGGGPRGPGGPGGGPPPTLHDPAPTVLVDRGGRDRIVGVNLGCPPAAAPANDRFTLELVVRGQTVDVSVDGVPATSCTGARGRGAVVLGSGVMRVQVDAVTVAPADAPAFTDTFGGFGRSAGAGALAALVGAGLGLLLGRLPRARGLALALLPLLAAPPLGALDLRGWLDTLRLLDLPTALGPLVLAGVPAAVGLALWWGAGARSPGRALLGATLAPLVALGAAAALRFPPDTLGWALLAGLAWPLAALAWVNTHPTRARVPLSYALTALVLVGAELGVRRTGLDVTWTPTAGYTRAREEFAELLELRRYRSYPDELFPVRPPERDPARPRIVALGGSSTGGAFQMDDLALFWPRRLEERLPGWEVVNQGVGGWNTLHMRLYLESQLERLDPDGVVVYAGHNDLLTRTPVPYRTLLEQYRRPEATVRRVAAALEGSRLYVGLRHALLALRDRGGAVAVPLPDARENLTAITAAARSRGAWVLLVTEGLAPDALPMRPWTAMTEAVAAETGAGTLDAASRFEAEGDPSLFLDDCHLSVDGHVRLAGWIAAALGERGWVGTAPGAE